MTINAVNPGRGEVALVVGAGVSLTLRFTTGALSSLQEAFGFPHSAEGCAQLFARLGALGPEDLPIVVFYGAIPKYRATLKDHQVVGHLLSYGLDGAAERWMRTVGSALRIAFPDPEKIDGEVGEPFSWSALKTAALRSGMTTSEFWSCTPREVRDVILASTWRQDQAMTQTWLGAAWSREGTKIPPLAGFVSAESHRPARPKANPDLMSLAKAWGSNVYDETGELIVGAGVAVDKLKDKN